MVSAPKPGWRVSSSPPAQRKGIFLVPSPAPASWPAVPGEQLCTRLAHSLAQSHRLPVPQGLNGFSTNSETLASKPPQRVALALSGADHVHSWTQCFSLSALAGGDGTTNCLLQGNPRHPPVVPQAPLLPVSNSAVLVLLFFCKIEVLVS